MPQTVSIGNRMLTAIGIGGTFQDLVGDTHLPSIVGGGDPEADDVGSQSFHHGLGTHHITQGLGHLVALGVYRKTVGQHALIRCALVNCHTSEQ